MYGPSNYSLMTDPPRCHTPWLCPQMSGAIEYEIGDQLMPAAFISTPNDFLLCDIQNPVPQKTFL